MIMGFPLIVGIALAMTNKKRGVLPPPPPLLLAMMASSSNRNGCGGWVMDLVSVM
jgi:hypothetical protein